MRKALLAFVAVALCYTGPALIPGRVLVPADIPHDYLAWKGDPATRVRVSNSLLSDVPLQLIPWDVEASRLIRAGEIPWQNRFVRDGEPLFANPLTALFSPFTWPRLAFGLHGWVLTVLLKMLIAACGMYWLVRLLGADAPAAVVSGVVFATCGFNVVWALYPHTNVVVFLPALAAACLWAHRNPCVQSFLVLFAFAMLATAGGHPETLFTGVVAVAAFIAPAVSRRSLLRIAAAALAGFLVLAIQLVPFAIQFFDSHARTSRAGQITPEFRPFSLPGAVLPGYLGSPLEGELDLTALIPRAGNFHQRNGAFVGAIVLLALLVTARRLSAPFQRGFLIALAALVLSLSIPGIAHLVGVVPVLQWVAPEYFVVAYVLLASAAAGAALSLLAARRRPRLGLAMVVLGGSLVIAGALPTAAPDLLARSVKMGINTLRARGHLQQTSEVYERRMLTYLESARATALRRATVPGACWALAGFALSLPTVRRRYLLLSSAAVAELIAFGAGYNPSIRVEQVAGAPRAVTEILARDPAGRWLMASSSEVFPPNLGTTFGVRDVHAYDILVSSDTVLMLLPAGYDPAGWALPAAPLPDQRAVLAARGVRWFIAPDGLTEFPEASIPPPARNTPPEGLMAGAVGTGAGLLLLLLLLVANSKRVPHQGG